MSNNTNFILQQTVITSAWANDVNNYLYGGMGVSIKSFGAIGDGNSHPLSSVYSTLAAAQAVYPLAANLSEEIDFNAIRAAMAYVISIAPNGGTVFIPPGVYLTTLPISQTPRIRLVGSNSRGSYIKYTGPSLLGTSTSAVISCISGTLANPGLVFSSSIEHLIIDANGLVNGGYQCSSWQENCYARDLVIVNTTGNCFEIYPCSTNPTNQASFENLHLISLSTSSTAIGLKASNTQCCSFKNISCVNGGSTTTYDYGIYLFECYRNTLIAIHTETNNYGIYDHSGDQNNYFGVDNLNNNSNGTSAFWIDNTESCVINNLQQVGYTYNYYSANSPTQRISDAQIVSLVSTPSSNVFQCITENNYIGAINMTKVQLTGLRYDTYLDTGQGYNTAYAQANPVHNSGTAGLVIDTGQSSGTGFSGRLTLCSRGAVRYSAEYLFDGNVNGSGTVSQNNITVVGTSHTSPPLSVAAPAALASPTGGKFKIVLTNTDSTYDANIDVKIEICTGNGPISSFSIGT